MSAGSNFDQHELKERVRNANDIVEIVGGYGELRRQGRLWVTRCPWHDDRRPSLQVNPARQSWKCWVCDIGGDVFSFVMKREGMDFPEALKFLAERAGIPLEQYQGFAKGQVSRDQKQAMYAAMDWVVQQLHQYLLTSPEAEAARTYLEERGILSPAMETFRIGYAPNQWSWLVDRAGPAGHDPKTLGEIGVAKEGRSGSYYDFYRGRVIFPIVDTQNRPLSLGGRILPAIAQQEEAEGRNAAKYINGPETKIYFKSDNLYGLNVVRPAVEKSRHLVIVEGYTDVVMAWQAGLENVVAVQGTALNEHHIKLIKRYADRVSLVLDGDEAGINRTNDILNLFVATDMDLRIMIPPDGLDPCDYLMQHSAGQFVELLDKAQDALDYKMQLETEGFDAIGDTTRATRAIDNVLSTIAGTPRSLVMASTERQIREQQILGRLSRRFQVEQDALTRRLHELRRSRHRESNRAEQREKVAPKIEWVTPRRWDFKQLEVLELLVLQPDFLELVVERIPADWFTLPTTRAVYQLFCQCYEDGIEAAFEKLQLQTEDPALQNILVSLEAIATEKSETSNLSIEDRMSTVLDWFHTQELKASQRKTHSELEEKKLDEDQELAQLQALIDQERNRQGIRVPTDG